MTTVEAKTNILRKEFQEIDANHDNFLSRQELFNYLSIKVKDYNLYIISKEWQRFF